MRFLLYADTRTNLLDDKPLFEIEEIVRRLASDILDTVLLLTLDESVPLERRERINVCDEGWLRDCVQLEIARSREATKKWRVYFAGPSADLRTSANDVRMASLSFVTPDGLSELHCKFDERALVPCGSDTHFGNRLSIYWDADARGDSLSASCLSVVRTVFDNDLFDYGRCCADDEYGTKNLDTSGGGVRAVGLDVSKHLSGFYWGNFFGAYLLEILGRGKVLSVPGCRSLPLGDGVFVYNELPPDAWNQPPYAASIRAAIDYLGDELFFEKGKRKESRRRLFMR